jgi:hypothetical protein
MKVTNFDYIGVTNFDYIGVTNFDYMRGVKASKLKAI